MEHKTNRSDNQAPEVVIVGSNMIDLLSRVPRLPILGETIIGDSFQLGFGGKGANQAVMAARLGARVGIVTKVGDDIFGQMTRENFAKQGISTEFIYTAKGLSSGVAPIMVEKGGGNSIVVVPGANMALMPEEIQRAVDLIRSARIVISQLEIAEETIIAAFRIAHEAGVMTILNPSPARPISQDLMSLTDILIPNETESEMLSGVSVQGAQGAEEAARLLLEKGVQKVIMTLGSDGALLFSEQKTEYFPGIKVEVMDTTGAGDAFLGSLAYALSIKMDLPGSIRFANTAAALSVTKAGTQMSFPTIVDVEEFIKHQPL
jgi:ribokinase